MKKLATLVFAVMLALTLAAAASTGYSKNPSLTVWTSEVSPFPASAGGDLFVQVVVRNYGQDNAEDVKVEFQTGYPFSLAGDREQLQEFPEGLCGLCDRELEYHFLVDENAKTGTYPITLKISNTYGGAITTLTRDLEVAVVGSKRILGISETNAADQDFGVGGSTELQVTLKNYGKEQLNYIGATLMPPSGIQVLGSNKRFITTSVRSGDTLPLSFDIVVAGDAKEGAYSLPLILNFKDASGTETMLNESIGIAVRGIPDLLVFAGGSDPIYAGSNGDLLVTLANIAPYNIKFLKIKVSSDELKFLAEDEEYIGDMDPNDLESSNFRVFVPASATAPKLKLNLQYRDSYNRDYTKDIEVPVKVLSAEEAKAAQPQGLGLGTIIIAVVIIGVAVWYWRKRHRAQ